MRRPTKTIIWLIILGLIAVGSSSVFGASGVSEYDDIQILKSDQYGVIFKYLVPALNLDKIELGGQNYDLINIDKCAFSNLPGNPQLPVRTVWVGVPLEGEVSVEILENTETERTGVNLAYTMRVEPGQENPVGYSLSPRKTKEAQDAFLPAAVVSFEPPTFLRNQRVLELHILPIRYNSARKSIQQSSQITVKIGFSSRGQESPTKETDRFENIYKNVLLNYDQSRGWRKVSEITGQLKPATEYPFGYSNNWYKLIVRENGLYKIDRTMLIQAGVPVSSLDPRTLRLFNGGGKALPLDNSSPYLELKELAIFVSGEDDGKFDASDFILFYGWSPNVWDYDSTGNKATFSINPFTNDNVFWLTFNPTASFPESPKRMQVKDGSPTASNPITPQKFRSRIHYEQDNTLKYNSATGYVDNYFDWYWMETASARMFASLPGLISQDTCTIKVGHAYSSLNVYVNTIPAEIVDSLTTASLTVARSFDFHGGVVDTLDLVFPSAIYLNWYEIEYPRRFECYDRQLLFENPENSGIEQFDISNLYSIQFYLLDVTDYYDVERIDGVQIEGEFARFQDAASADFKTRYFLADESKLKSPVEFYSDEKSDLKEVSHQADFLIITPEGFYDQMQSLKSFRQSYNQMSVEVVKVQDVYDEFSGGLVDPVAIRNFLKFAYQNWSQPVPAFTLLVGDGNYDFKNNLGTGSVNLIPPFTPIWDGDRSVSDENYVYFGKYGYLDSDSVYIPTSRQLDMVISRWPVKTKDDVTMLLGKVIGYEQTPEFGTWRNLITLVADDEYTNESNSEAFHTQDTEELSKYHIPASMDQSKIYLMEYPFDFKGEKPQAEDAIVNAFNSGTVIVNYMGHGNPDVWAHEKVFKRTSDIPRLNNQRKLPLVYTSSCSIGLFFNPIGEGMAEELLRAQDKGAVATISATWLVYPDPNAALNYKVYDLLLNSDSLSIGEALFTAKLLRQPNSNDRQYVLFGDPVMKLGLPELKVKITSITPDTFAALSLVEVKGEVRDRQDSLYTGYNGMAKISAFDSQRKRIHTMPNGGKVYYDLPGLVIFKGDAEVTNGSFIADFVVPKDISYGGNTGRISVYLSNQDQDGEGGLDSLVVRGSDTTVVDTVGPEISLSFDDKTSFSQGETILPNSLLKLFLYDEHGINITGEVGHGIVLVVDQDLEHQIDLSADFEYQTGSYQRGGLVYQFSGLSAGEHSLSIKAWDNANNSSLLSADVKVSTKKALLLTEVMNYPNPFSRVTNFYYRLSSDAERVEVKIFTLAGRLIRQIPLASAQAGINYSTVWDGRDQVGDEVATGVYIYKITAEGTLNGKSEKAEALGKAVVVR
jgi:hypothetical protein